MPARLGWRRAILPSRPTPPGPPMPTGAPRRWGSSVGTTGSGFSAPDPTYRMRPEDGQPVDRAPRGVRGYPHEVPAADRVGRLGPGDPGLHALAHPVADAVVEPQL